MKDSFLLLFYVPIIADFCDKFVFYCLTKSETEKRRILPRLLAQYPPSMLSCYVISILL